MLERWWQEVCRCTRGGRHTPVRPGKRLCGAQGQQVWDGDVSMQKKVVGREKRRKKTRGRRRRGRRREGGGLQVVGQACARDLKKKKKEGEEGVGELDQRRKKK